jgi:glycosyltransferase involved in cell wall biosynthesis
VPRSLRIAWLGPAPADGGGVPGVARELLGGLADAGHLIDCFLPGAGLGVPAGLASHENLAFVTGTSAWQWDRWYSRSKIGAFATGLLARGLASLRLRQEIARRHEREPYDLIYQFSNIESLAVPSGVARSVPLVLHPETHIAGELRCLLAERRLALRCQPRSALLMVVSIMSLRALVQRVRIRRASLLVCISSVFRDHLVRDYRFPASATLVVPNPVRLERFADIDLTRPAGDQPTVLVLGRIAVRKGVEDVVAIAETLNERGVNVHLRIVGGPSLWSDYTKLLEHLPSANAEYVGMLPSEQIPGELAHSDVLLQASKYEPFALTVAEALAAGVPVVATCEVGAIEGVDRLAATVLAPGDVAGMSDAIVATLQRLSRQPREVRGKSHSEAERLFAPELICARISRALEQLVAGEAPTR